MSRQIEKFIESNKDILTQDQINELNRIDGGGWEYNYLGNEYTNYKNLNISWDLYKFYNKVG